MHAVWGRLGVLWDQGARVPDLILVGEDSWGQEGFPANVGFKPDEL